MTTLPKNLPASVRAKAQQPQVDLTPMLDVVFILLIFFVVAAIQFEGWSMPLENQPPSPQSFQEDQPKNILIDIHDDGRIIFNGDIVDIEAVRAYSLKVLAENPQASVIIRPTFASKADHLVRVMDYARSAGVSDISILE